MQFVIIHGAFGSPEGNWFPELKGKLELLDQTVLVPHFPVESWDNVTKNGQNVPTKHQTLENWLEKFEPIYQQLDKKDKICFVGHSLGPLFILHAVDKWNIQLDSAIFVSPFLDKLGRDWQIDQANATFYKTDFDFEKLKRLIPVSYVLYSDNDPYVEKNHAILFSKALDSSLIFVKRAGHMNSEVNMNEFPLVFDLCSTRIDLPLYQKYLLHRHEQEAMDLVKSHSQGSITLPPEDALDEGIFHFKNLRRRGFSTFYTGLTKYWETQSKYYQDARQAARRVKDFTRVFIFDNAKELTSNSLKKQIELDLKAGIKIYAVPYDAIKNTVTEPDFGIWDDNYVCIVHYNHETMKTTEVELNSRKKDLAKYLDWERYILKNATLIKKTEDLTKLTRRN